MTIMFDETNSDLQAKPYEVPEQSSGFLKESNIGQSIIEDSYHFSVPLGAILEIKKAPEDLFRVQKEIIAHAQDIQERFANENSRYQVIDEINDPYLYITQLREKKSIPDHVVTLVMSTARFVEFRQQAHTTKTDLESVANNRLYLSQQDIDSHFLAAFGGNAHYDTTTGNYFVSLKYDQPTNPNLPESLQKYLLFLGTLGHELGHVLDAANGDHTTSLDTSEYLVKQPITELRQMTYSSLYYQAINDIKYFTQYRQQATFLLNSYRYRINSKESTSTNYEEIVPFTISDLDTGFTQGVTLREQWLFLHNLQNIDPQDFYSEVAKAIFSLGENASLANYETGKPIEKKWNYMDLLQLIRNVQQNTQNIDEVPTLSINGQNPFGPEGFRGLIKKLVAAPQ